jgi:hypothetical protein
MQTGTAGAGAALALSAGSRGSHPKAPTSTAQNALSLAHAQSGRGQGKGRSGPGAQGSTRAADGALTSSTKRTTGAILLARLKMARTYLFDSPSHLDITALTVT